MVGPGTLGRVTVISTRVQGTDGTRTVCGYRRGGDDGGEDPDEGRVGSVPWRGSRTETPDKGETLREDREC